MSAQASKSRGIRQHLPEIILSSVILLGVILSLIFINAPRKVSALMASVYRGNETLLVLDLSQETAERDIPIEGEKTPMVLTVKKNAIRVKESGCPSQYCVHQAYVSSTAQPIICAYNGVSIVLTGISSESVVVG